MRVIFCFLFLSQFLTKASSQTILKNLYIGLNGELHYDMSLNSQVSVSKNAFYSGNDKTNVALGNNYGFVIGYYLLPKCYLESGIGIYNLKQSFETVEARVMQTRYKDLTLNIGWTHIPIKLGWEFEKMENYVFSFYLGAEVLVDRIRSLATIPHFEGEELEVKPNYKGPAYPGTGYIFLNDYNYFGLLGTAGLRAAYKFNSSLSISAAVNLKLGINPIQSGAVYVFEKKELYTTEGKSFSATNGSAMGSSLGIYYRLGSKKMNKIRDSK